VQIIVTIEMSQGDQPLDITIRGVIDWNENEIITNLPEQPEFAHLLRGGDAGTVLPRISRATLMLEGGGTEILRNISLTGMTSTTRGGTTTYRYTRVGPQ
jgi:hypothetical protein